MLGKLRVYELAKELGIPSKRIIELLAGIDVNVKNHMSMIEEQSALKIKAHLRGENKEVLETLPKKEKETPKKERKKPLLPKGKKEKTLGRKARKAEERSKNLAKKAVKTVMVEETVNPRELADALDMDVSDIMTRLINLGFMSAINEPLDPDVLTLLADELNVKIEVKVDLQEAEFLLSLQEETNLKMSIVRPPVATILGHVDHGKTSLLDAIRKTNVTAQETGGITQHIGAYQVKVNGKKITFLDTPGHEAFTAMRARGAKATDIAIVVVAADDGVMPQTVEAINHAKAADVPIIVAINKIDKENANPDRVKQQLAEYNLVPEEWGGETVYVHVSAIKKEGLEELLEMILLVAEIAELKADPTKKARGTVIEARLDKSKGVVTTILIQDGTLEVGDPVICGTVAGKIKAMHDYKGKKVKKCLPATPVEILGLGSIPETGDILQVVTDEKLARQIALRRLQKKRLSKLKRVQRVTLENLFTRLEEGETNDLNIIIKADVHGSVEALQESLLKLDIADTVYLNIIHSGVGAITESDIMLAAASNAIVIGFNVRPFAAVRKMAEKEKVEIRLYRVIYEAIEDLKKAAKGMLAPEYKEVISGQAEVRQLFKVSKVGTIAGCYVLDGKITRQLSARIIRDGIVVHEGSLSSLKRFKEDAKEVLAGFECGIMLEKFNDLQEGDIIEGYFIKKIQPE